MKLVLDMQSNALDSFNEALAKFESGQAGNRTALKFSILHLSHCIELVLKLYVQTIDEHLIYRVCYSKVSKLANSSNVSLLTAYASLISDGLDFSDLVASDPNPYTISAKDALSIVLSAAYNSTDTKLVDAEFVTDVGDMQKLRNAIEHYEFEFTDEEVRLLIGRLVRGLDNFTDASSLLSLEKEVGKARFSIFSVLVDEYEQTLSEAHYKVQETRDALFRGTRPKEQTFIKWNIYYCEACGNDTIIPNNNSSTGYRCTYCGNEESEEIEVACDVCGVPCANGEMNFWSEELSNVCPRCSN